MKNINELYALSMIGHSFNQILTIAEIAPGLNDEEKEMLSNAAKEIGVVSRSVLNRCPDIKALCEKSNGSIDAFIEGYTEMFNHEKH